MSNTGKAYSAMRKFGEARSEAIQRYRKVANDIQDTRGSKYHADRIKAARDEMNNAIEAAKAEVKRDLQEAVDGMSINIGKIPIPVPSEEDLRIVQAIKMRDRVSQSEIEAAANSVHGNSLCLSILQEVARRNNLHIGLMGNAVGTITPDSAQAAIKSMVASCRSFIDSPARHAALKLARMSKSRWGQDYDELDLPEEKNFESEDDFISRTVSGIDIEIFKKAVNGEG